MNHQSLSAFIWSVADLLRGDYKQSDYGKIILPFTVLRRLDCVLESTKAAVLAEHEEKKKLGLNADPFLLRKAKQSFYNISPLDMKKLMGDQDHIKENLFSYIQGFSEAVRDIFERFEFMPRSTNWLNRGFCIKSLKSSSMSTCTPTKSVTAKWGWCLKNSSASLLKSPTKPQGNTLLHVK